LDDIHADESRQEAELKAKKAAAIAAAMDGEEVEEEAAETPSILDAAEALEPASEKTEAPVKEAPAEEEVVEEEVAEEAPAAEADYSSMTVAELKELLKAAGKPVSGKKADLITRLNE
jgi:hypothetical protein